MRVLLVDDDAELAREVAMGLRGAGARVEHADSASEGRRVTRAEKYRTCDIGDRCLR